MLKDDLIDGLMILVQKGVSYGNPFTMVLEQLLRFALGGPSS